MPFLLRLQHHVPNFETWKRAFDSDPLDRKGSGVRRYHVHRAVGDPGFVVVDLELDSAAAAEALLQRLRQMWNGPAKAVMQNPEAWVVETVETKVV
jgi:hypothetical protein